MPYASSVALGAGHGDVVAPPHRAQETSRWHAVSNEPASHHTHWVAEGAGASDRAGSQATRYPAACGSLATYLRPRHPGAGSRSR
jgi:hypothetical protein